MKVWHLFLGLVAGLGIPIQAAINTRLGAMFGDQPLMAAFVSFTVGALLLFLVSLLFVDWQAVQSGLSDMQISDWWKWLGGALGAFFVFASIFLAPKIGVTNTVFLFILGQLVMGMVVDSLGLFGMPVKTLHWSKFLGIVLMLVGVSFFMFGQKWFAKSS